MNLTQLVGSQLGAGPISSSDTASSARLLKSSRPIAQTEGKISTETPVLQLNQIPVTLIRDKFENPKTNSNPNGSLTTLFAFRQLVDPIPAFYKYYAPTDSTEAVYGTLVHGATIAPDAKYARTVFSNAQERFDLIKCPSLDGIPVSWRPVYATPEDWYDTSIPDRFVPMELNTESGNNPDNPYITLGEDGEKKTELCWHVGPDGKNISTEELDQNTQISSIKLKYLKVELSRPWFSFEIFDLKGWKLDGQPKGFLSSGSDKTNDGVLPLLPMQLIIGIDAEVTGKWRNSDLDVVKEAASGNKFISLGPFVFNTGTTTQTDSKAMLSGDTLAANILHVVGWISSLVPQAPQS